MHFEGNASPKGRQEQKIDMPDDPFRFLKQNFSPLELCRIHGIEVHPEGSYFRGKCPIHHEQNGETLVLYPNTKRFVCFGKCHFNEDVIGFHALWAGLGNGKAAKELLAYMQHGTPLSQQTNKPFNPTHTPARDDLTANAIPGGWGWRGRGLDPSDPDRIAKALKARAGYTVARLRAESPCVPEAATAEDVLGVMFEQEDLICCCKASKGLLGLGKSRSVKEWIESGELSDWQYLVYAPLKHRYAQDKEGKSVLSPQKKLQIRLKPNILPRCYLDLEFDRFSWDEQASIISYLAEHGFAGVKLRLTCVTTSCPTGRSLHPYWCVRGMKDEVVLECFDEAVRFGADHTKWNVEGLGRLPGGFRSECKDGTIHQGRQEILYLADRPATNN